MSGRTLLRDVETTGAYERITATGIEGDSRYWVIQDSPNGIATLSGLAPEIRLVETDQADPAGRWGLKSSGGILYGRKALTAAWASAETWLSVDSYEIALQKILADDTDIQLKVGVTGAKTVNVAIGATDSGVTQGFEVATAQLQRLYIDMSGLATFSYSIDLNGTGIQKAISLKGDGASDVTLWANLAATDATAKKFIHQMLDPATDTFSTVLLIQPPTAGTAPVQLTNPIDAASVQSAIFEGDRVTMAANDEAYITYRLSDSAGNQDEQVRFTWKATTITNGATQDADAIYSVLINNSLTEMLRLKGEDTGVNITVSANVPTTSTLAAGQIRYIVDGADTLIAYWNKAGSIKTLTIGILV